MMTEEIILVNADEFLGDLMLGSAKVGSLEGKNVDIESTNDLKRLIKC